MPSSKTSKRALPCSLARYMAASASRMRSSGRSHGSPASATPTEVERNTSLPARTNGSAKTSTMRPAIASASGPSATSSQSTVNSSPPWRATLPAELAPPQADNRGGGAQRLAQPPRDVHEQRDAGVVAERGFDQLEAVAVQE